jgi:transcriptional regulator with XRE-family HTH domain
VAAGELKESIVLPKKTAEHQRAPNRRLKYERELRGWSQQYVATQINAERYYVSRWEIGTASPRPDYRRKLCELFGMNAEELGLLAGYETGTNGHRPDQVPHEGITSAPLAFTPFLYDPAIPPQPAAYGLVGRDELLDRVKQRLLAGESLALSALNGLPGSARLRWQSPSLMTARYSNIFAMAFSGRALVTGQT